jgi:hypothetical protein
MRCFVKSSRVAFVLFSAMSVLSSLAGCDDAGCPVGTMQVGDRCRPMSSGESPDSAGAPSEAAAGVGTGSTANASSATGGSSSVTTDPSMPNAGSMAAGSSNAKPASSNAGSVAAAGTSGSTSSSMAGAAGNSGAEVGGAGEDPASGADTDLCSAAANGAICDGTIMHTCDAQGKTVAENRCTSEALCSVGLAAGVCADCDPGVFRCTGSELQICKDGQFALQETCASAALCKESAGSCTELACMPNTKTCDASGTLKTCSSDGSAFDGNEPCGPGLCDAQRGRCRACVPNAARCEGNTAMQCSSTGDGETPTSCSAPSTGCATSSCQGGRCVSGTKPQGTSCGGSKKCTASGQCVDCIGNGDCTGENQMCQSNKCVTMPCGDTNIDSSKNENCDPKNVSYVNGTQYCTNCRISDTIYLQSCNPRMSGGEVWPGSSGAGWICSGQGAFSRICTNNADCGGSYATCNGYYLADGTLITRACTIPCSPPPGVTDPWIGSKTNCPGGMSCYYVNGQGGGSSSGGTCGWSLAT